jgi:transposase-like protein
VNLPPSPPFPSQRAARAIELYAAGVPVSVIAAEVDAFKTTVTRWARRAGLGPRSACPQRWRDEWSADALEMQRQGISWREISRYYGVSQETAQRQVRKAILERRLRT